MKRRPATEQNVSRIDPTGDEELIDEASEIREEIGATLTALMPWGISILAHVALIVLAFFLVWQTIVNEPGPEKRVIPSLTNAPDAIAPTTDLSDLTEAAPSGGPPIVPDFIAVNDVEIVLPSEVMPPVQIPVPGESTGIKDKGVNKGTDGIGTGIGLTPSGNVKDVVFLIDASGSMVDVLPFVINELKEVVVKMKPVIIEGRRYDKRATVIFFSGEGVHEVPGGGGVKGLRTMTPTFKNQVREWVSLENFNYPTGARGSAHVKAALTQALSYQPKLIILLSDNLTGGGQGATQHELMQDDLLELIHEHNKAKPPTKINTIQFLYEDPLVRQGLPGTLDRIAKETGGEGGKARFVTERDLGLR